MLLSRSHQSRNSEPSRTLSSLSKKHEQQRPQPWSSEPIGLCLRSVSADVEELGARKSLSLLCKPRVHNMGVEHTVNTIQSSEPAGLCLRSAHNISQLA